MSGLLARGFVLVLVVVLDSLAERLSDGVMESWSVGREDRRKAQFRANRDPDEFYEQNGKDLFVAKYTLNQSETGGYESYCVWSKTVASLLPKSDLIAFFDPAKPESQRTLGLAKWEDVMRIVGDLFLDTQMFPAWFYVSKFLTEAQLAAVIQRQRC